MRGCLRKQECVWEGTEISTSLVRATDIWPQSESRGQAMGDGGGECCGGSFWRGLLSHAELFRFYAEIHKDP